MHAALAAAEDGDAGRLQELIARLAVTAGATAGPVGSEEVDEVLQRLVADLEEYEADDEARGEERGAFGEVASRRASARPWVASTSSVRVDARGRGRPGRRPGS